MIYSYKSNELSDKMINQLFNNDIENCLPLIFEHYLKCF